ncbi:MAG TPA: alpha/beta hydrolase [Gammaproteobacteria bacterium]
MRLKVVAALGAAVVVAAAAAVVLHGGPSHLGHAAAALHGGAHGAGPHPAATGDADAVHTARARIAALGDDWNAEAAAATGVVYAELRGAQSDAGIVRTDAISYGPDPAQTLDLFVPEGGFSEGTTVLVYLHGDSLAPNADNVTKAIASVGGIGVLARYRNGPAVRSPAGAEDVRLLLNWVNDNIEQHGGDRKLIVLMGNSTGATHIAEYLFDQRAQRPDGLGMAAAILSSGVFDGAFGDDLRHYFDGAASSVPLALVDRYTGKQVPLMLWSAEYDPPLVQAGVAELFAKLCRSPVGCPTYERLAGANHVSHVLSLGSSDTAAAATLFRFYHTKVN